MGARLRAYTEKFRYRGLISIFTIIALTKRNSKECSDGTHWNQKFTVVFRQSKNTKNRD